MLPPGHRPVPARPLVGRCLHRREPPMANISRGRLACSLTLAVTLLVGLAATPARARTSTDLTAGPDHDLASAYLTAIHDETKTIIGPDGTATTDLAFRDDHGREVTFRGWNVSGSVKLNEGGLAPFHP